MSRFLNKHDYQVSMDIPISVPGKMFVPTALLDVGEHAEQVDIVIDILTMDPTVYLELLAIQQSSPYLTPISNPLTISDQESGSGNMGPSIVTDYYGPSFDVVNLTNIGQYKSRLQTWFDDPDRYPWLGAVEGRYIMLYAMVGGIQRGSLIFTFSTVTISSKKYPADDPARIELIFP
jgi:hypothetical protein